MLSKNDLKELNQIDITQVKCNELKELTEIHIDEDLDIQKKLKNFFHDIKNPYCFKIYDTPVKINFSNSDKTLNDCLFKHFTSTKNEKDML